MGPWRFLGIKEIPICYFICRSFILFRHDLDQSYLFLDGYRGMVGDSKPLMRTWNSQDEPIFLLFFLPA